MRQMGRASLGLALLAIVAACGLLPIPAPDWVANRNPLPACGEEDVGHGEGWDVEARRCVLDAYRAGRGGELVSTMTSVEGDDIRRFVRVHENGTIEIFVDATRDRFGSGEWERFRCERLLTVDEAEGPGLSYPDEMVFVEDGCEPLPLP